MLKELHSFNSKFGANALLALRFQHRTNSQAEKGA